MKIQTAHRVIIVGSVATALLLFANCNKNTKPTSSATDASTIRAKSDTADETTQTTDAGSMPSIDTQTPEKPHKGLHKSCAEDTGVIIPTPKAHDKWIKGGFVQYTEIVAPNGKPIRIFAQDKVPLTTMYRTRNILRFFLEDVPGTEYGTDKVAVANAMANNNAVLMLPNGAHEEGKEPPFNAQPLFVAEMATEGSAWYQNNNFEHRDASFEEIFHLVHDTGIGTYLPGAIPAYQKKLLAEAKAAISDGRWGIKVNPDTQDWLDELAAENSLAQEYIASVIDSYYGFWGPWNQGKGGMWGVYIAKTRAEVAEKDPKGKALLEAYLNPWLTYEARLDPSFTGTFKMTFDKSKPYTHKSQYLTWVTLTGGQAANIDGNPRDNTLRGNTADNTIDGREGSDSAIYCHESSQYTVSKTDTGVEVKGPDGTDTLRNIETIVFADKTVATESL